MSVKRNVTKPLTFFLNETHELVPGEKSGGGRPAQYTGISWATKSKALTKSLGFTIQAIQGARDPLKGDRYFVLAEPVPELEKLSTDKKKAPNGTFKDPTDFGGAHGRVFDRLGLDLLQVTDDGRAIVHGRRHTVEQLVQRAASLEDVGPREQSRWATIDSFGVIPAQLRFDADWVQGLKPKIATDIVIELQPVLNRVEADIVLRAIADLLAKTQGEKLVGSGTDFSGRYWFRGRASSSSVREIAKDFYSVQSIHSPLLSMAAAKGGRATASTASILPSGPPPDAKSLPCVAILDLGIASDHRQLAPYRRSQFIPQDAPRSPVGDHGAFVASRIVFGDCASDDELAKCVGQCSFYDAVVADYPDGFGNSNAVNDKIVMEALRGVRSTAPDVRVFNLSFGDARPLAAFQEVERREKRLLLQDLDNFIFSSDSIVVVAAGNSAPRAQPNPLYPGHHADGQWALGPWACGYSTLVCGSFVSRLSSSGLVKKVGWPSPFSRVGPGICEAPVPSFGAPGGNTDEAYGFASGLGVWGLNGNGLAEDRVGTSYSAPLLAREAAMAIQYLQSHCLPGSQPFAVLVRAFFALTATRTTHEEHMAELSRLTLGHGVANSSRLAEPANGSAVILWQGFIDSKDDKIRVQLPVPISWLNEAEQPVLRLAVSYDPPVNEAAHTTWSCRKIKAVLHVNPDGEAVRAPSGTPEFYPLFVREYKLSKYKEGEDKAVDGDMWLLEMSYDEIAPYPPAMDFDPRQRVAFAAELVDRGTTPIDPQAAMQALPIAVSMTRLSVQPTAIRSPIIIRTRRS